MTTHMDWESELIRRFTARQACVGVVGLGYVGLPTVRAMHDAGFDVLGYDIDETKIERLSRGEPYLTHVGEDLYRELAASPRFTPTVDSAAMAKADAIIICVPTPLGEHHEPDLQYVERSTEMVGGTLRAGQVVILASTSYPGTTRDVCGSILASRAMRKNLAPGRDYFLAFSPEREDPGRHGITTRQIPRLVGGVDEPSERVAAALFTAAIDRVIPVGGAEVAEAAKLLENIYRAVNIALVNELKPVLEAMGIDIWRVIEAAATKPYGYAPFYPGPGLGGHCIPVDPYYLTWKARQVGMHTRFIELAGEINSRMPARVVEKVIEALNLDAKAVRSSRILVLGIAYKPDIDDIRESPAAEIIGMLRDLGADVSYHDPHIATFPTMRKHAIALDSVQLTDQRLAEADCALIITHHRAIDWALVGRCARLIVDTRNVMAGVHGVTARVVKA